VIVRAARPPIAKTTDADSESGIALNCALIPLSAIWRNADITVLSSNFVVWHQGYLRFDLEVSLLLPVKQPQAAR
jgi:hypothetical protein